MSCSRTRTVVDRGTHAHYEASKQRPIFAESSLYFLAGPLLERSGQPFLLLGVQLPGRFHVGLGDAHPGVQVRFKRLLDFAKQVCPTMKHQQLDEIADFWSKFHPLREFVNHILFRFVSYCGCFEKISKVSRCREGFHKAGEIGLYPFATIVFQRDVRQRGCISRRNGAVQFALRWSSVTKAAEERRLGIRRHFTLQHSFSALNGFSRGKRSQFQPCRAFCRGDLRLCGFLDHAGLGLRQFAQALRLDFGGALCFDTQFSGKCTDACHLGLNFTQIPLSCFAGACPFLYLSRKFFPAALEREELLSETHR